MRQTPLHPRTSAACTSYSWKEWAGYAAVRQYTPWSEEEYFALRHAAGLLDVTPLYKYEVTGPDAGAFLARVWCRDIARIQVGRVVYSAMADEQGKCLDDGTVARLDKEHYRVTSSEPWLRWLRQHARGFTVRIEESTDRLAAMALQGPASRDVLKPLCSFDLDKMRFFRVRAMDLAGVPVWVSRTGYTGDLGFEIWVENERALKVWDAVVEAGRHHGLLPVGLDALDVVRIEAGFVLQGVDYISSRRCLIERRKSTPAEAGLGWTVDLDNRDPFIGQEALLHEKELGQAWTLVGLDLDWGALERLYEEYDLPPHLAPIASRQALPVFDAGGQRQVGQATSSTWSPLLKRALAIGQVRTPWAAVGSGLYIEHTVEFERRIVPCTVVEKPFFDPPRKRSIPEGTA